MTAPVADVRAGDPDGPIVVCVHGGMDRTAAFNRIRRGLHQAIPGVTTVAYDRRGYASSVQLPVAVDFARQVDDLIAVTNAATTGVAPPDASGARRPVVIVGHSLGGTIALAYAARRPDGLVGVVAGEPPMSWLPWWPSSAGASTLAAYARSGPEAAAESFMRRIVGDRAWELLPESTRSARRAEGEAIVADLSSLRAGGEPFRFDDIAVPVVIVRGTRSPWHNRRGSAYAAARVTTGELRVLDGARHAVHTERPDDHVLAVSDLLARSAAR